MKTAKECRQDAIGLKHRLRAVREMATAAQIRANKAQAKLDAIAMLSAGMRVGGSAEMADAIDEILGLKGAKP